MLYSPRGKPERRRARFVQHDVDTCQTTTLPSTHAGGRSNLEMNRCALTRPLGEQDETSLACVVQVQTCRPTGRNSTQTCLDGQRVLLGQARATATGPPLLLMLARASCIAAGITGRDSGRNGHSDVMPESSIAMPFPRWQHASTLAVMPMPYAAIAVEWLPARQLYQKNSSHISTFSFHFPAFLPIATPKLPPPKSITRTLYDYYDPALVNDCCCACPPATLVNTPTTLSLPPPTDTHPR